MRRLPLSRRCRVLIPDDEVHVLAKNHMDVPVDVNVLYIGADYSISHWFAGRLQPGDELKKGLFKITDDVLGRQGGAGVVRPRARSRRWRT